VRNAHTTARQNSQVGSIIHAWVNRLSSHAAGPAPCTCGPSSVPANLLPACLPVGVYARGMSVADDKPDLGKLVDRDAAEKATRRASASAGRQASGASTPTASSAAGTPPLSRTVSSAVGGSEGAPKSEGKQVAANVVAISVSAAAASPRVSACASQVSWDDEQPAMYL
jgi:hypothetical protein